MPEFNKKRAKCAARRFGFCERLYNKNQPRFSRSEKFRTSERITAIELMAELEEIQGQFDDAKEIIDKQIAAIEKVIQKLIGGGVRME